MIPTFFFRNFAFPLSLVLAATASVPAQQSSPQTPSVPAAHPASSVPADFLARYPLSQEDAKRLADTPALAWIRNAMAAPDFATRAWTLPEKTPIAHGKFGEVYFMRESDLLHGFLPFSKPRRKGATDSSTPPAPRNILFLLAAWRCRADQSEAWNRETRPSKWNFSRSRWPKSAPYPPREIRRHAIARALVAGADPRQKDENGNTPQNFADEDAAEIFMAAGVDAPELLLAAMDNRYDDPVILDKILKKYGAAEIRNEDGYSPIHIAVRRRSGAMARKLLEAGANPDARDEAGLTPIHHLFQRATDDARLLGSGPFQPMSVKGDSTGMELLKLLVRSGADVNALIPGDGLTVLHIAALTQSPESTALLLCLGADPTIKNNAGLTPEELLGRLENKKKEAPIVRDMLADWVRGKHVTAEKFISSKIALPSKGRTPTAQSGTTSAPGTAGTKKTWEDVFPNGIMKCGASVKSSSIAPLKRLRGDCVLLYAMKDTQTFSFFRDFASEHRNDVVLVGDPFGFGKTNADVSKQLRKYKVAGYTCPIGTSDALSLFPQGAGADFILLDENLNVLFTGNYPDNRNENHLADAEALFADLEAALASAKK